ncbi:MAG: efflux RND transporter periplasmic adaptor subunit [Porphyromonadaceae bacterium]|nr:efflux RND transporter periplasmic adaptor subunit [Porphyromonadaceae bacterium]
MKKGIIIAIIVIIVVAVGAYLYFDNTGKKNQISYATVSVGRSDISKSVTATGTIEPVTEVEVGTQVSGIIAKIYVDYNSVVKEGQLIAEMDKVTLESDLESAKATYDGNLAEYEYQRKNFIRNKKLYKQALISEQEYDDSEYNYKKSKSAFENSKASLAKAERNLSYAIITSPIDGIVTSRDVEEGQTVASGYSTPTLFNIAADLTQMEVVADVDEADIGGVEEGQRVSFTVDAYPNDVFEGQVLQIRLGSTNSSSTSTSETVVTYEVIISAPNPDLKLKPRLTANVTIYTLDKHDVLSVPAKALRFTPEYPLVDKNAIIEDCEGTAKVWSYVGNTFTAHPVNVGISNGIMTEILDGLEEGEVIIEEAIFGTSSTVTTTEDNDNTERSPFMPTPPGRNKKKSK